MFNTDDTNGMASRHFRDLDVSNDYDKAIEDTGKRMAGCDPCSKKKQIDYLIHTLNQIRSQYPMDKCIENVSCLGLLTPHRARMDRRIATFESERKLHEGDCESYLHKQREQKEDTRLQKDLVNQIKIKEMEFKNDLAKHEASIQAAKESVQTVTRIEERTGHTHHRPN